MGDHTFVEGRVRESADGLRRRRAETERDKAERAMREAAEAANRRPRVDEPDWPAAGKDGYQ